MDRKKVKIFMGGIIFGIGFGLVVTKIAWIGAFLLMLCGLYIIVKNAYPKKDRC